MRLALLRINSSVLRTSLNKNIVNEIEFINYIMYVLKKSYFFFLCLFALLLFFLLCVATLCLFLFFPLGIFLMIKVNIQFIILQLL
ncbi:Uncharacterised protein [Chryseobacterium taklimakanense]|uniref:Uncharacterized protein n=1 Tax=Chryseobacterium taklimakanense TaxID=536441 RepID=A0A239XUP3_9FLAO|nr:Uncharacterised protein [Chryseobacterium taklimakanense]